MNYTEKNKNEVFKILQNLKKEVQDSIEYSVENIENIQLDAYFSAEESLERISVGILRLEEECRGDFNRERLIQLETRLFFLEDRFEEIDAELRQRPIRRRRARIGLFDFFRFSQGGENSSSGTGEILSANEAFAVFELPPDTPLKTVTARFRKMAKELHPDANGGDRRHEPRLRKLISAYQTLKEHYKSK